MHKPVCCTCSDTQLSEISHGFHVNQEVQHRPKACLEYRICLSDCLSRNGSGIRQKLSMITLEDQHHVCLKRQKHDSQHFWPECAL